MQNLPIYYVEIIFLRFNFAVVETQDKIKAEANASDKGRIFKVGRGQSAVGSKSFTADCRVLLHIDFYSP
jgi:hypothetical protein